MLARIKTQKRIVSKNVNLLRELFRSNEIELNDYSIQSNLKVVGYAIPIERVSPIELKKILEADCTHLVTFNSISSYSKYAYKDYIITITYFDTQTSLFIK